MPKAAKSQKCFNKEHTSTTAAGAGQSRARQVAAAAAAKKNSHQRGKKLRHKLSRQQAAQTRDLLDVEFREFRGRAMRQQQEDLLRCEGTTATTAGSSAPVSEGSVQDLAGILSAL